MSATRTVDRPSEQRPPYQGGDRGAPPAGAQQGAPSAADERAADAARRAERAFACEVEAFMKSLDDERATLKTQLPKGVDLDRFIETARMAVQQDCDLIKIEYRTSLFLALLKAAKQGLLPDKKEGALILRYNKEARRKEVCWQPMVWGVVKLGRRTGDIRTFKAMIVYQDEPFRYISGDEDRIEHERIPEQEKKGLSRARGVYAIVTARDGAKTRRWMEADRVRKVKASSTATHGPWYGPFEDEMWIKTILLFTLKWVNTDAATDVFREAIGDIQDSLEVDLDAANVGATEQKTTPPVILQVAQRRSRLDAIEDNIAASRGAPPAVAHDQTPQVKVPAAAPVENVASERTAPPAQRQRATAAREPQRDRQAPAPHHDVPDAVIPASATAAPAASAQLPEFSVYGRDETGQLDNEGKPFTSPVAFAKWLAFLVAQVPPENAADAFRENQEGIDLAYAINGEAAAIIEKLGAQSKGATRAGGGAQSSSADKAAAAQRNKDAAWANALIENQISKALNRDELDRCTVGSEAFKVRMARLSREYPDIADRIRAAYGAKLSALPSRPR